MWADGINFHGGHHPLAVLGNTYAEMSSQKSGCRLNSSTSWCGGSPDAIIGGQCSKGEDLLPPACGDSTLFDSCKRAAGIGGICYNSTHESPVLCLTAAQLAQGGKGLCKGYTNKCTIFFLVLYKLDDAPLGRAGFPWDL